MKTYTIRPLEWKRNSDDLHVAKALIGYYKIDEDGEGVFGVELEDGISIHPLGTANTIDAAHDCFPDGWTECWNVDTRFAFRTINDDGEEQQVNVDRTPEEKTDRFRLAVKAIVAMEDGK